MSLCRGGQLVAYTSRLRYNLTAQLIYGGLQGGDQALGGFNSQLKLDASCDVLVINAFITYADARNLRFRMHRPRLQIDTTIVNAGHLHKSFVVGDGITTYALWLHSVCEPVWLTAKQVGVGGTRFNALTLLAAS